MKILLLAEFFLSGQTTHVLDLAEQLKRMGCDVHVRFTRVHSPLFGTEYAPRLKEQGIAVSTGTGTSFLSYLVRRWRPDVIHAHSSTLFASANRLARRLRIPSILTCHGLGFSHPKYQEDLRGASHVIAIGPKVAQEIRHICPKLTVIPNGVNTEYYVPPQGSFLRNQVVYIARMDRGKIPALTRLTQIMNSTFHRQLMVVADWDPKIAGIVYHPWTPDLRPILQQAGIVAASGRTAREALACGSAVLLMQRRYDGLVSPALTGRADFDFSGNLGRFTFSRLRSDLKRLLTSRTALQKLQRWGRRYAEDNLNSANMAAAIAAVYAGAAPVEARPKHRSWQGR
ncbi:MAG: glycosyltransferase family 4 protein [Firmicutes bacterium]|nr:glycosyltransferase family 4 protein [Bacillota bacterium]